MKSLKAKKKLLRVAPYISSRNLFFSNTGYHMILTEDENR